MKYLLILKAHHDICGDEIGLITHQSQFFNIRVKEETIDNENTMLEVFAKYRNEGLKFDFIYLCTHADGYAFDIEMGIDKSTMTWARFSQILCEGDVMAEDTIIMLACCRGGLFNVATYMFAVCYKIKFVCGAKWTLRASDLATGFVVFLYNILYKKAEPTYAAQKATLATDYTFSCHDRSEIESHPQYENKKQDLYEQLGWTDADGNWIIEDATILANLGDI